MSDFKISVVNGQLRVVCEDEIPETDIIDLLEFDETRMEDLYKNHAAIQARWEQIAINLKNSLDSFVDGFEKKWWAHNKRFAKFLLIGYGDKKPTIDTVKDNVILIYSDDTTDFEKVKYGEMAYSAAVKIDSSYKGAKEDFMDEMFKYSDMEPSWSYEAITRTVKSLEKDFLSVQSIAKRLESRSFHMKELKDLVMAKQSNMGPMTDRDNRQMQQHTQKISGYHK